ncbi:TPA: DUF1956 domain-containing protein [Candidatus Sumerlaeota bacterium]|jgi:TetR/AcrR family transcriptional regulator, regulator of cefoperazone and chloramphenicol sensitivity|nr:DUF1956 domain-containing protein [Candidatus Sumerlaeota bacterium]
MASHNSAETRERLLEAATEIFAENGYRHTTFRDICQQAGTNNAAINYHFRDKEQLYIAVIQYTLKESTLILPNAENPLHLPPREHLREFLRVTLFRMLGVGSPTRLLKLMAKEMAEPTPALDVMVETVVRPIHDLLHRIVAEILGEEDVNSELVASCCCCIMGQCHILHTSRAVVFRLSPHLKTYDDETIEKLAAQIYEFSIAALDHFAAKKKLAVD